MKLEGKVALVTGAARGIGRAIALGLASGGASVAVSDLGRGGDGVMPYALGSSDDLERVAREIEKIGRRATRGRRRCHVG